jgi:hypothetical protein
MARKTVTIEIDEDLVDLLEEHARYLMEMKDLAGVAPHGQVFDRCEDAVVTKGRELQRRLLERAVESRIESAEKKGRR